MKKQSHHFLIVTLLILLFGHVLSAMADTDGTDYNVYESEQTKSDQFSPRNYCINRGGTVTNTKHNHVFICCSEEKLKCNVVDINQTVSWVIPYSERFQNLVLLQLEGLSE